MFQMYDLLSCPDAWRENFQTESTRSMVVHDSHSETAWGTKKRRRHWSVKWGHKEVRWNSGTGSEEMRDSLNERSKAVSLSGCADCDKDKSDLQRRIGSKSRHILLQTEASDGKNHLFQSLKPFPSKRFPGSVQAKLKWQHDYNRKQFKLVPHTWLNFGSIQWHFQQVTSMHQ